jgi:hypothetical protein
MISCGDPQITGTLFNLIFRIFGPFAEWNVRVPRCLMVVEPVTPMTGQGWQSYTLDWNFGELTQHVSAPLSNKIRAALIGFVVDTSWCCDFLFLPRSVDEIGQIRYAFEFVVAGVMLWCGRNFAITGSGAGVPGSNFRGRNFAMTGSGAGVPRKRPRNLSLPELRLGGNLAMTGSDAGGPGGKSQNSPSPEFRLGGGWYGGN